MARAVCPVCGELIKIEPTPIPVGETGTARRWQLARHVQPKPLPEPGLQVWLHCDGSRRLV